MTQQQPPTLSYEWDTNRGKTTITRAPETFWYGIEIGVVVGVLVNLVVILSPPVEWWVEDLSDRALGAYGAFLVLIGSALQTVQYIVPLIAR